MHSLIKDCYKIEDLASQIYLHLSNNNNYPKEVCKVFAKLSGEEKNHAGNLDLLMQASKQDPEASYKVSWDKVNQALQFAEESLALAKAGILSELQALTMALEMEEMFLKAHAQNVLEFQNQKFVELFEELGKDDQSHIDILKSCITWWHSERKSVYFDTIKTPEG